MAPVNCMGMNSEQLVRIVSVCTGKQTGTTDIKENPAHFYSWSSALRGCEIMSANDSLLPNWDKALNIFSNVSVPFLFSFSWFVRIYMEVLRGLEMSI